MNDLQDIWDALRPLKELRLKKGRPPLLSDDGIELKLRNHPDTVAEIRTIWEVRDFYENLITEGRLIVVDSMCADKWCGCRVSKSMNHCPGCGSMILE